MRRLLLCSLSVPWPTRPLLGSYHVDQALALREVGVDTHLFSPAPRVPRWSAVVSAKCRAHAERPRSYRLRDVHIGSPRVRFFLAPRVRRLGARLAPGAVAGWARTALRAALLDAVREVEPHALLAHSTMPWAHAIEDVAGSAGLPFGYIEHSAEDVLRLRRDTRLGRFYARAAGRADVVFAVGGHMADHLRDELGLKNVVHLPNGTEVPSQKPPLPRPADGDTPPLVLSAGHYYTRKGFEVLIEAFHLIASAHPRARLCIVTDPPASLQRLVNRLDLADRVCWERPMPRDRLLRLMARADVFALASWSEAFGLVALEAMAAGTPIVITRDCGLAPMVTPLGAGRDAHGWVVEPQCPRKLAAALSEALQDRSRLDRMGVAGRSLVQRQFGWQRNAETVATAFGWPQAAVA